MVTYKGYKIVPKKDFGGQGYLIDGKMVKKGWVVTKGNANVMPGAIWFQTIDNAKKSINVLEKYGQKKFWKKR